MQPEKPHRELMQVVALFAHRQQSRSAENGGGLLLQCINVSSRSVPTLRTTGAG